VRCLAGAASIAVVASRVAVGRVKSTMAVRGFARAFLGNDVDLRRGVHRGRRAEGRRELLDRIARRRDDDLRSGVVELWRYLRDRKHGRRDSMLPPCSRGRSYRQARNSQGCRQQDLAHRLRVNAVASSGNPRRLEPITDAEAPPVAMPFGRAGPQSVGNASAPRVPMRCRPAILPNRERLDGSTCGKSQRNCRECHYQMGAHGSIGPPRTAELFRSLAFCGGSLPARAGMSALPAVAALPAMPGLGRFAAVGAELG
jgi:hypothetical protein